MRENESLYTHLREDGYTVVFKEVLKIINEATGEVTIKGNVDAELVLQAMIDLENYRQAVLVSSDGDFACLVKYLVSINKLLTVLAPCEAGCSHLLVKSSQGRVAYVDKLRKLLEYRPLK
ncbi:MAG: NYN domain-containing protein [Dehalococcoidales bacterium]|nr:NYN domain-containing protein [Dehalococcoidales bacterium]